MSTIVADNPKEQEVFNSMAAALSKLPVEVVKEPEGGESNKALTLPPDNPPPPTNKPTDRPPDKPAEKPPELNPLEDTKRMTPKAREQFEHIRSERDEFKSKANQTEADKKKLEAQVADFNKQIAELKSTPKTVPELEALKKERDQLNEILNVIRVEEHPEFQKKWNGLLSTQMELAKSIVGPALAKETADILAMTDGADKSAKLEELKSKLNEDQLDELKDVRKNLRLLDLQKNSEIKQSRERYKELKEQENAKVSEREQQQVKLFTEVGQRLSDPKDGWAVFQKTDNPEWNREVDDRLADAQALFTGKLSVDKVAENAYRAAAFPAVTKFASTLIQENAKLKEQIAGMSAANPKLADAGKTVTPSTKETIRNASDPQVGTQAWVDSFVKGLQGA